MRLRWSWLVAAGALALLMAGLWQRRGAASLHGANGAAPPVEPHLPRDPAGMTKAQLYEEAKRLGIPGRSQMSRDELLRAVLRARN
jgi:hypothetical protein